MPELRVMEISNPGYSGYLYLHAFDRLKQVIENDVVQLGLVPLSQGSTKLPATWINYNGSFDVRDITVPAGELRVGFFVKATSGHWNSDGIVVGDFYAWLNVTDTPEVEPFNCGRVRFS